MANLHVFASFQSFQRALTAVGAMKPDDSILLRGDALYELVGDNQFGFRCYAVRADALARGLAPEQFTEVHWVDHDGWVDMVLQHETSLVW